MDNNPELQLKEKIKHCQETVANLLEEYGSRLRKQSGTSSDSEHQVKKSPIVDHVNKQLRDIVLALESIQQQVQPALEKYYSIQPAQSTSAHISMIQNDDNHSDNQIEIGKSTINQRVGKSGFKFRRNGQNPAKLNLTTQALFKGTLPDEFYLHLMFVMGIQECLINNRLVSPLWNALVLERCQHQKSLKLFETIESLINYGELLLKYGKMDDTSLILKSNDDDLFFGGLEPDHKQLANSLKEDDAEVLTRARKQQTSKVFTNLFPGVEELVLYPKSRGTFINIEHLLRFYAKQLTSLTMTNFGAGDKNLGEKLAAFRFPKLLSLNVFHILPEREHLLSLLPQLESLSLSSTEISLETILRTGTQICELSIGQLRSVYTERVKKSSKRSPINTKLRKFTLNDTRYGKESEALEFISLNLTSLEFLKLTLRSNMHLHSLTSYLVSLQHLPSLTLQAPVSVFILEDKKLAKIQPLPSVRHLTLLLCDYESLSMDLFSRSIFTAFPNAEQVRIAFVGDNEYNGDGRVDAVTFAAFEDFAGQHPNVVQLFRSMRMSKFTSLPNDALPLLGHRRQMCEEYLEAEDLFGVPICDLAAALVNKVGEDGSNLMNTLQATDRFTAMSNLLHLFESNAFAFFVSDDEDDFEIPKMMLTQMVECALQYGPSEGPLFKITCKCVLSLLGGSVLKEYAEVISDESESEDMVEPFFEIMLKLLAHYQGQQFADKDLLLQMYNFTDKLIKEMFKKTEFGTLIKTFLCSENRAYRVETGRALLRVGESSDYPSSESII